MKINRDSKQDERQVYRKGQPAHTPPAEPPRRKAYDQEADPAFAEEPLPVTSPYIGLDNVILTPHVASSTVESLWNIYTMAIDVAYDFFHGTESAQTKRCWLN